MTIPFRDDMIPGDWRAAQADSALSQASLASDPLPSRWEFAKQNFTDAHRVANQAANLYNLSDAYDAVNDRIKTATGAADLFNPMQADPFRRREATIAAGQYPEGFNFRTGGGATPGPADDTDLWQAKIAALRKKHPDALDWDDVLAEPQRRAWAHMKATRDATDKMTERLGLVQPADVGGIPVISDALALAANAARAPTYTAAQLAGGVAGTVTSLPDMLANLLPFGAGRVSNSLIKNALLNATSNAALQMPLSATKQADYQAAGLPHGFDVWMSEVAGAAGTGFALDAVVRGGIRGARRAAGQTRAMEDGRMQPLGGVLFDAVPETRLPGKPTPMADIPRETIEAARNGDLAATRTILETTGAIDNPEIRGAMQHAETVGQLDAVMLARLDEMGVARAEGFRIMDRALNGGYARPADALADIDRKVTPPQPAIPDADADRVIGAARAALDAVAPRMSELVADAVEARIPEIETPVRAALSRLTDANAKADPGRVAADLAAEIRDVLADRDTADRVGAIVRIGSGRASTVEMAGMLRATPGLRGYFDPEIGRHAEAIALATLDDAMLGRVAAGEVPPSIAAHIADTVPPDAHQAAFDVMATSRPQSMDEAVRILAETVPDVARETIGPLDNRGGRPAEEPQGAALAAKVESLRQEAGDAVKAAQEPIKARDKLDSKVEGLRGDLAKLDEKAAKADGDKMFAISEADALTRAKKRAELHQAETELKAAKARLNPDREAADALYRVAMASIAERRALDIEMAVAHAVAVGRAIAPEGTRIEVRSEEMRDPVSGRLLDAYYDKGESAIVLARYATDPAARMSHEVVHALVAREALSRSELELLAKEADKSGVFTAEMRKTYADAYAGRANLDALLQEEAAAHLIDARIKGTAKGPENTIANRIAQLMERIRNLLNGYGFKTADDISAAITNGEQARLAPVRAWMRENDVSAMAVRPGVRADAGMMMAMADRETGQSMRRDLDALGYYSQALEAARSLKQARGTLEQMLAQLKNAGVKDAEIEATGLRSALDGKPTITRDEIVKHLEENRVGLRERTYSGQAASTNRLDAELRTALAGLQPADEHLRTELQRAAVETRRDPVAAYNALSDEAKDAVERYSRSTVPDDAAGPAQWSSYSLDPSNPTYRETVLHLPDSGSAKTAARQAYEKYADEVVAKYGERGQFLFEIPSERIPRDVHQRLSQLSDAARDATEHNQSFQQHHFPDVPNVIGHMMTSMTRHEGKPVYTVDQIQSDWGQKLRDGGVKDEAKIAELEQRYADVSSRYNAIPENEKFVPHQYDKFEQVPFYLDAPEEMGTNVKMTDAANAILQERDLIRAELSTAKASAFGNPLVNTTDQWVNTTLRRAIRQAAEADAAYIAIPHGDTVLSYNPGDENGMRGFYGSRTSEGIVPKNLRKLIERMDKAAKPFRVESLETPGRGMVSAMTPPKTIGPENYGFTLFPLTDKVKTEVLGGGQAMFAFAGERAKTADLDALTRAKEMETDGTDRTAIWTETGWFRGVDGKWRFEIDDSGANFTPSPLVRGEAYDYASKAMPHESLYNAYPQLTDIDLITHDIGGGGSYMPARLSDGLGPQIRVGLAGSEGAASPKSVALHEAQHGVQDIEGMQRGGGTRSFTPTDIAAERTRLQAIQDSKPNVDDWSSIDTSPAVIDISDKVIAYSLYHRLAGEVEARAVQKRMDMSAAERRARPPWLDYDVPEDQQIVRFADGSNAMSARPEKDDGRMFAMADTPAPPRPILETEYAGIDRLKQVTDMLEACAA